MVENTKSIIQIIDKNQVSISNVQKIISFNPSEFVVKTATQDITVKGANLEMENLNNNSGDIHIKGDIFNVTLNDDKPGIKAETFFKKLFK